MNSEFIYDCYEHEAQYYETDQMGCVHHSNYIRWFEEARTALLSRAGFSYKKMEECGIIIPVLSVSVQYKSMVHYQDIVKIQCRITEFNGIKFKVEYQIRDKETDELRTTGESSHCFLNKEYHPVSLKKTQKEIYDVMQELFLYCMSKKSTAK